jgi:HK97 family phage portal protein
MAFVATAGSVQALSRSTRYSLAPPSRIQLSSTYYADYAEIYRTQESVRTVVSFLARNIAQLGLHFYERVGDADRRRLQDHPLALMLRQPNPWTTRYRFIQALVCDFAIYDRAYWLKTKITTEANGLVRIPPQIVTPEGDNWLTPNGFKVDGTSGTKIYPADQVVYFRGYGLDKDTGISPLEALRRTLREEFAASEMREQVMRNGARMSGYLERPKDSPEWSDAARNRFRTAWQSQYSGNGPGAGGTPILEDGMQFKPVSQTARDLQYIESRKLTREEVAAAYFIPPPMIGILDNATFSNISEQHKMLYQDTLAPILVMIEEEIELQLLKDFEPQPARFYVEFNMREKLTGSFEERAAAIAQAVGGPTMTVNEARALDNRPPIEGGDALIVPLNVTQNGDQSPIPAAPPEPAAAAAPARRIKSDDDYGDYGQGVPEAGGFTEGQLVSWDDGEGVIEHLMIDGTLGIEGSEFAIEATEDDPAALIRIYQDNQPTELLVGKRTSELSSQE